uniref:UBA domain-containing protein n=1 Tax=Rhabditophanes sp. KR3021 TaxID=114890 RepID=A0AC35UIP5_9BILA
MFITIVGSNDTVPLDVDANLPLKELHGSIQALISDFQGVEDKIVAEIDGKKILPVPLNLDKPLSQLGFYDQCLVNVSRLSFLIAQVKREMTKVQAGNSQGASSNNEETEVIRRYFDALKNAEHLAAFKQQKPDIAAIYEANADNFENFRTELLNHQQVMKQKIDMMRDENNAEGQRMIEEAIRNENIHESFIMAQEHMPETFVKIHMLYVHMKLNGYDIRGFIDSGAQTSVISRELAEKCGIMRVLDERFQGKAFGVGGENNIIGRVHGVKVEIGTGNYVIPFSILESPDVKILIGLDFLRRYSCTIDLSKNNLSFCDGNQVPFLGEDEVEDLQRLTSEEMAQIAVNEGDQEMMDQSVSAQPVFVVDEQKVTQVMDMGFEEGIARRGLEVCENDVAKTINFLFESNM